MEVYTDGRLFIAMACYEGETLKERIARGPLPVDEAIEITVQVAQGLAKAHGLGIVHRDIKPANLMRSGTGTIKIADLGLATAGESEAGGERVYGTPHFISPEQARGDAVLTPASDVYAPIDGTVAAVNEELADTPETINSDPYGEGWIVKLQPSGDIDEGALLTPDAYQELLDEEDA
mgnify:CR=1 FL=1